MTWNIITIIAGAVFAASGSLAVVGGITLLLGAHGQPLYMQNVSIFCFLVWIGPHVIWATEKFGAAAGWIPWRRWLG